MPMVDINNGLLEAVRGVVEGVIGKAKEVIGALTGRDDLFNEGQAQQQRARSPGGPSPCAAMPFGVSYAETRPSRR